MLSLGHLHVCPSYSSLPMAQSTWSYLVGYLQVWQNSLSLHLRGGSIGFGSGKVLAYESAELSEIESARGSENITEDGCV